ncbi:restriction endonuclease subunit S [Vibrio sp. 10N.222.49.C12]|uniref:restriction endonuclease subunit S n=1 Tax=Vibrio sp. 10N.222.49.C12 TaxID=3229614 RepID=UPI0035511E44
MAGRYKAYTEYKESNYEWLGEVPRHWDVAYSKWLFSERNNKANQSDEMLTASQKYGVIPQKLFMKLEQQKVVQVQKGHDILKQVKKNDFVISMRSFQGGIEFCEYDGAVSSAYVPLEPKEELSLSYFKYLFKSKPYIQALQATTNLVRDGQALRYNNFLQVKIPVPEYSEAKKIGSFLDHETAKIDTLITKQEKLIELLKEKRQAVISHAVTKGLNPDAPMKDSGVEWLGEVPEHWVVCCLKHIKGEDKGSFVDGPFGSNLKSEHFVDNGDVYVIESNFATTGLLDTTKLKTISTEHFETISRSETTEGAIIIAKIGARYGMNSVMPTLDKKAVVSGNSLSLKVNEQAMDVQYCHHLLTHLKQEGAMDDGVNVTAQPALSLGQLNNLPFLRPSKDEQQAIVDFVQKQEKSLSSLILNAERMIELSRERKTALISAAVTGKVDVRDFTLKNGEAN